MFFTRATIEQPFEYVPAYYISADLPARRAYSIYGPSQAAKQPASKPASQASMPAAASQDVKLLRGHVV